MCGPFTPEHVAERLREAAETLRQMAVPRYAFPAQHRSSMPEPLRPASEFEALNRLTELQRKEYLEDLGETRVRPQQKAIDRALEAAEWSYRIERRDRMVLWARSDGQSLRKIAHLDGRSHETMKQVHWRACETIARMLNRLGKNYS